MSNATTRARRRPRLLSTGGLLGTVRAGAFSIFAAALAVSYMHLVELAEAFGESGWRAYAIAGTVDTIILAAVAGGMAAEQLTGTRPPIVGQAMYAGITTTLIGNIHHGLRANLVMADFPNGGLVPDLAPIEWAQVLLGVLVALWAPIVADLAYRVLLWAATVEATARAGTGRHAEQAAAVPPQRTDEHDQPGETVEPPAPTEPTDPDGAAELPPADGIDAQVIGIYDRMYRQGQALSERRLVDRANNELQLAADQRITRHRARACIKAWKARHAETDTGPMPRLVVSAG
ncbi:hypothetical protein [Streptomonospora litoralis]|uniref:DUF2637 domain-containing protein n=1 Tax=Streptomonospora litoralis TaxID=2498135 RepID=A0A4P6PYM7_9ACTN|nr:hypothetical protein [Streptomonospora litoralis]QBI53396.1 hypothetical protein EKD16_08010 [Streptomonospora litoralis]